MSPIYRDAGSSDAPGQEQHRSRLLSRASSMQTHDLPLGNPTRRSPSLLTESTASHRAGILFLPSLRYDPEVGAHALSPRFLAIPAEVRRERDGTDLPDRPDAGRAPVRHPQAAAGAARRVVGDAQARSRLPQGPPARPDRLRPGAGRLPVRPRHQAHRPAVRAAGAVVLGRGDPRAADDAAPARPTSTPTACWGRRSSRCWRA